MIFGARYLDNAAPTKAPQHASWSWLKPTLSTLIPTSTHRMWLCHPQQTPWMS